MPCGYLCPEGTHVVKAGPPSENKARERPWVLDSTLIPQGSLPHTFLALSRSGKTQNLRLSTSNIYAE